MVLSVTQYFGIVGDIHCGHVEDLRIWMLLRIPLTFLRSDLGQSHVTPADTKNESRNVRIAVIAPGNATTQGSTN